MAMKLIEDALEQKPNAETLKSTIDSSSKTSAS